MIGRGRPLVAVVNTQLWAPPMAPFSFSMLQRLKWREDSKNTSKFTYLDFGLRHSILDLLLRFLFMTVVLCFENFLTKQLRFFPLSFYVFSSAVIAVMWHPCDYALVSCDKTKRVIIWTDDGVK